MKHNYQFLLVLLAGLFCLSCAPMLEPVALPVERPRVQEGVRPPLQGGEKPFRAFGKTPGKGQPPCESEDGLAGLGMQERRLQSYKGRSSRWQALERQMNVLGFPDRPSGWQRCLDAVVVLHDRYELKVRQKKKEKVGAGQVNPPSMATMGELLQEDISYLESGCDDTMELGSDALAGWVNQVAASLVGQTPPGKAAENYYETNMLLSAARELHGSLPAPDQLPESRRLLGFALLESGQLESAANVLGGIKGSFPVGGEEIALRLKVADLLLAVGRVDEARKSYAVLDDFFSRLHGLDRWVADQRDILETVDVRSNSFVVFLAVMRAYLAFDGERLPVELKQGVLRLEAEAPGSLLARRGRRLLDMAEGKAGGWVHQRLLEVDNLVEAQKVAQAKAILENMAERSDLDAAQQALVSEALSKVRQIQVMGQETQRMMLEQELTIFWEDGIQLLDQHKFDESIAVFSALLGTDYDAQAREKIVEASDLAARKVRSQASLLFVQARKTADPERKKALLMDSWEALKSIETKYPNSTLLEKVRDNLAYLENHIGQVEPALLGMDGPVVELPQADKSAEELLQTEESGEPEEEILD